MRRASATDVATPADSQGWQPERWLGAPAPGGLALPSATPAADTLYAPRGVWIDEHRTIVADTGNHRLLIWANTHLRDHGGADVLLGQDDWSADGANNAGRGAAAGMQLPTGVLVHDGALIVCDAWNHRILVWHTIPETNRPADLVLGQPDRVSIEPNRGGEPNGASFYWPFGAAIIDGGFWVADTGNRRVLGWLDGIPDSPEIPADVILGQPDPLSREENRGAPAAANSFRWPHAITEVHGALLVADAGNHRVLGWQTVPHTDVAADLVIGQPDFTTATEFPYAPQTGAGLRFPYGVSAAGGALAIADTANNRILLWESEDWYHQGSAAGGVMGAADGVLAQPTMAGNGENRWEMVARDTLCWPYGLHRHGHHIAVADSGNNRVMIWKRP